MNYIVFDLEWNQSCSGRIGEHPRMPFEIIEIGAAKVDKSFKIVDTYAALIKPRIYKKLHAQIRKILNYDEHDLEKGRDFKEVCKEFLEWCGEDYMFVTWGPMDLAELQTNMDFYYMPKMERPLKYINLQDVYAEVNGESTAKVSRLEKAVDFYNIPEDIPFHSAVNDAIYTAKVMQKMKPRNVKEMYSFDLHALPRNKDDEIHAVHNNKYEYVSRDFVNKNVALKDDIASEIRCYKCNRKVNVKVDWFANSPTSHICAGKCWRHGYFTGKIKFRTVSDNRVHVIKTMKPIGKIGVDTIKEKQNAIRAKRKERRHQHKAGKNNK